MRSAGEQVLGGAWRIPKRTQGNKSELHSFELRRGSWGDDGHNGIAGNGGRLEQVVHA
jgi:hypothetical protein